MIYKAENINCDFYSDLLFETAYNNMSSERQQKADRFVHTADKRLCVFSDMLLRDMLETHFGLKNPVFSANSKGKPILLNSYLHFNISHSKNFVACAIDTKPVGIDIQSYNEMNPLRIMEKICTEEESEFIKTGADGTETLKRFYMVWSAKEAYLKYTGEGLSGGLQQISVANKKGMKEKLGENIYLLCIAEKDYSLSVVTENPVSN